MWLRFVSDGNVQYKGFNFSYNVESDTRKYVHVF